MTQSRPLRIFAFVLLAALLVPPLAPSSRARAADDAAVSVARRGGSKRAEVAKAVLNVSALQPGKDATAAIVFKVKPGFHAQSHTPTADYLVAFEVKPTPNPALTFGEPKYPAGKTIPFQEPKELNVYEGEVTILVPVKVKPDAATGPLKIEGTISEQICDDKQCFAPEEVPFTIETEVVSADKAVQPNEPELFKRASESAPAATAPSRAASGGTGAGGTTGSTGGPAYSLPVAFGLAFLVGILFNAVPCVLPVLPLKAMGFYEVSQHNRARSLSFGIAFSLGVIASFGTLGMLVVVLKVFKWGELFSNPWFSGVLALILLVMALNMFGLFTVNLPSGMYAFSPRHDTYFGNVLFGILTAALSTPCTFGLFVSVLATAATQRAAVGLLLVIVVGVGMAFPYLVLSAFPELARRFPRTGPWSEVVKQLMGFMLLGVAIFFAQGWVGRVVGQHNVFWVIYATLAAGAVFLVARAFHYRKGNTAPVVAIIVALLMVVPTFFVARQLTVKPYQWTPYSSQALADARAANKVVLVDFTADWCANCHTVEALVLNRLAVQQDVNRYNVEMIKADLSDKKAPGWDLLRELGGEGIPLTVVYSPGTGEPIELPGLYSVNDLRNALAQAARGRGSATGATVAQR
jgi:thiol:disulfide interchange protein